MWGCGEEWELWVNESDDNNKRATFCFRGDFHFYYYIDGGVHCHAVVDVDSRTYRRTAENWYPAVHGGVDVRLLNRRKIAVCQ